MAEIDWTVTCALLPLLIADGNSVLTAAAAETLRHDVIHGGYLVRTAEVMRQSLIGPGRSSKLFRRLRFELAEASKEQATLAKAFAVAEAKRKGISSE